MRFINLEWVIGLRRVRRFELAQALKISEGAFCHKLSGQKEFAPHEKQRIAEFLGYQASWLFAELRPPESARLPRPMPAQGGAPCAQA
jgi:hypothetical protein